MVKVGEIRRILEEEYGVKDKETLSKGKKELVEYLERLKTSTIDVGDTTNPHISLEISMEEMGFEVEEEEEKEEEGTEVSHEGGVSIFADTIELPPPFNGEDWKEYVMRQFAPDELADGNPKCEGLRRLVTLLIGNVVEQTTPHIFPPTDSNRFTSTVCVRMVIDVNNDLHPMHDQMIIREELSDVNTGNTQHPYSNHPSATAVTRGEARIFRKLLGLKNVVSAEEISDHEISAFMPDNTITEDQIRVIDLMCKRCNLDVPSLINHGSDKYDYIEKVKGDKAQGMIQYLNKIQQKRVVVEDLPPYDESWLIDNDEAKEKGE